MQVLSFPLDYGVVVSEIDRVIDYERNWLFIKGLTNKIDVTFLTTL